MRALVYPEWDRLEINDVDEPEPGSGEVLIRVAACGICGSEIESVVHRSPRRTPPLILGHEFCGTIVSMADDVANDTGLEVGSRVVPNAVLSCGDCAMCRTGSSNLCTNRTVFGMQRQGAFAELVTAPARELFDWPSTVEATAVCLAEPLANGVHVASLVAHLELDRVVIVGAGSIGLMCLQAIRNRFGSAICVVTDLDKTRLDVAERLGAHATGRPDKEELGPLMAQLTGWPNADLVVDAAGVAATKRLSLELCRPGGAVVWIGLGENSVSLDTYHITLGERSVIGSYGATTEDMKEALRLMAAEAVDVSSWVTVYEPERWVDGFTRQLDPSTRDVKAVLTN